MRVEFTRHKNGDDDRDKNEIVHGITVMSCFGFG